MDCPWSVYQIWWEDESIDALNRELTFKPAAQPRYSADSLYWVGYMYRFLYFHTDYFSAEIIRLLSFDIMLDYYPFMHTLSYEQALERILDSLDTSS